MKEYIERAQLLKNLGYDETRRADVLPGSTFDIVLKEPAADVAEVRSTMDWIRIDRMLPEPFVSVLCYMPKEDPFPKVHEGYVDRDGIWYVHGFRRDNGEVTHWADMPEYPE